MGDDNNSKVFDVLHQNSPIFINFMLNYGDKSDLQTF